ncbi:MAG: LemA family protein [Methanomicrobiales archaeon]|jgi:LemA protein
MEPFETFIWKRILVQLGGVIAISAILGGFVLSYNASYNNVVNLGQLADERWVGITRDMQERYGGIPGLADDLRPSMGSDASSLDEVTRNLSSLRAALEAGDIGAINPATTNLEASLALLSRVLQEHPEVAASREVQDFMATLEGTEGRISADRSRYNEEIQTYNRAISSFPASLWTNNWGFSRREYFTARIGSTEPTPVPVD